MAGLNQTEPEFQVIEVDELPHRGLWSNSLRPFGNASPSVHVTKDLLSDENTNRSETDLSQTEEDDIETIAQQSDRDTPKKGTETALTVTKAPVSMPMLAHGAATLPLATSTKMHLGSLDSHERSMNIIERLRIYHSPYNNTTSGWQGRPEIPGADELIGVSSHGTMYGSELLPNKLDGPWDSVEQYLGAQYKLMREDSIASLRAAVQELQHNPLQMEQDSAVGAFIYERVYISGFTMAKEGLAHRLDFSTGRSRRRISWASSRRLKPGTMVALTPVGDYFRHECLTAVVAARPLVQLELETPSIDVYFGDVKSIEIDPQVEYLMVEASVGYYEASRHTMTALQHMAREKFPLSEHIVFIQPDINPPEYRLIDPDLNVNAAFDKIHDVGMSDVESELPENKHIDGSKPDAGGKKPGLTSISLDDSQYEALVRILSKCLAIIQGPPGTGKTYVSVVALRVLLANKRPGSPPIIVTAQTNHALDQLLRHIMPFAPNFIRMGGQTQDFENVEPRTLFRVREAHPNLHAGLRKQMGILKRKNKSIVEELRELLKPLMSCESFSPKLFLSHGLITKDQYRSLVETEEEWIGDADQGLNDDIRLWAGTQVKPFMRSPERIHGTLLEDEEEDLDDLRDAFLERGVMESDEKEMLRGVKFFLSSGYTAYMGVPDIGARAKSMLEKNSDMYKIPQRLRGPVYMWLQNQVKESIRSRVRELAEVLAKQAKEMKLQRWQLDVAFLQNAPVIGLTTTGLSKYRGLIDSLQPQIVLIEEAAETQEAYVTAACLESVEHLILVGDHQQLRAHCQSKGMEKYNLHVSLFERLVEYNQLEYQLLTMQRRMLPEMRYALNHIYPKLADHPCVQGRSNVPGMGGCNMWFMTHSMPESMDSYNSWVNEEEAHLVAKFYEYLVANGTPASKITVLTFYNGQKRKILQVLRQIERFARAGRLNVCTVDSYQGEENDVIILSLVRNNDRDRFIGFLNVQNRVCVALSRARRGLYLFGNARKLHEANQTWANLIYRFTEPGSEDGKQRLGKHLPLICQNHGNKVEIRSSIDWVNNSGGCGLHCGATRPCGHKCLLYCHSNDHRTLPCHEPCSKKLGCGHKCSRLCSESPCQCKGRGCEGRGRVYGEKPPQHELASSRGGQAQSREAQLLSSHSDKSKQSQMQATHEGYDPAATAGDESVYSIDVSSLSPAELLGLPKGRKKLIELQEELEAGDGRYYDDDVRATYRPPTEPFRRQQQQRGAGPPNATSGRPFGTLTDEQRAAAIKNYQELASGGLAERDRELAERVRAENAAAARKHIRTVTRMPSNLDEPSLMDAEIYEEEIPRPKPVKTTTILGKVGIRTKRREVWTIPKQQDEEEEEKREEQRQQQQRLEDNEGGEEEEEDFNRHYQEETEKGRAGHVHVSSDGDDNDEKSETMSQTTSEEDLITL